MTRHCYKSIVFTHHCCLLFLVTRHLLFCCFLFNVFVGAVWCVCHPYFSWSSICLVILMISPPLSPPNGALFCGTSHLSLCIITAHHRNITMSQIHRRWSNLYLFTSRITIYIFVRPCMAPHNFLCALLQHVTEILLWVWYVMYIQIYIEIRHGNHLYCCTSLYDVLCITDNILYCCATVWCVMLLITALSIVCYFIYHTFIFVDVVYITPLLMCGTQSTHSCLVHGED